MLYSNEIAAKLILQKTVADEDFASFEINTKHELSQSNGYINQKFPIE